MQDERFEQFFSSPAYAVAGAAKNREKFGNKVLRCYLQHGKTVYPVNPRETALEGRACCKTAGELPDTVKSISVVTPPSVTVQIVQEAIRKGIRNIWMQPGAQSDEAIELCRGAGINVIADGNCILRFLGFDDTRIPAKGE